LIILLPHITKQTSVVHFDKMHLKYHCEALSSNSIQGGAIGNPNGKSGTSLFVNRLPFAKDNYNVRHMRAELISAVRANTNRDIDLRFFVQIKDNAG
jgi:hypothetical protein